MRCVYNIIIRVFKLKIKHRTLVFIMQLPYTYITILFNIYSNSGKDIDIQLDPKTFVSP
jgi:hypothetical protein